MSEEYINPKLTSGISYVMSVTASKENAGQSNCGYIWYEPEFSLCKTAQFRKLYEYRAIKIAEQIRRDNDYKLDISVCWTVNNELIVMTSVIK
jgi:hypothetical protein